MHEVSSEEQDRLDMTRLKAGQDTALDTLMQRHGPRILHYLARQLQDETEAADLAQETFVRVYQHRGRFDPRRKFTTWLYTIATNLARDRQRRTNRHPQVSLDVETDESGRSHGDRLEATAPTPPEKLQAEERAAAVRNAVSALPDELRTPLILVEYEDCSQAEIAAMLDCSVKAVEMRLYRARQQLREELAALLTEQ